MVPLVPNHVLQIEHRMIVRAGLLDIVRQRLLHEVPYKLLGLGQNRLDSSEVLGRDPLVALHVVRKRQTFHRNRGGLRVPVHADKADVSEMLADRPFPLLGVVTVIDNVGRLPDRVSARTARG